MPLFDHTIPPLLAAPPDSCNRSTPQDFLRHCLQQGAGLLESTQLGRSDVGLAHLYHVQYYLLWLWPSSCTESSTHSSAEISLISQYHTRVHCFLSCRPAVALSSKDSFKSRPLWKLMMCSRENNTSKALHHAKMGPGIPQSLHPCFDI